MPCWIVRGNWDASSDQDDTCRVTGRDRVCLAGNEHFIVLSGADLNLSPASGKRRSSLGSSTRPVLGILAQKRTVGYPPLPDIQAGPWVQPGDAVVARFQASGNNPVNALDGKAGVIAAAISPAARALAAVSSWRIATRYSAAPPRLTRRTPAAASSVIVTIPDRGPRSTFTGFGATALATARIAATSGSPGA